MEIDVNLCDNFNTTPLMLAVDHKDVTEILLQNRADVNAEDRYRCTALHYAVIKNRKSVVKLLLKYKANINTKNIADLTPLEHAKEKNRTDIVELLEKAQKLLALKTNSPSTLMNTLSFHARALQPSFQGTASQLLLSNQEGVQIKNVIDEEDEELRLALALSLQPLNPKQ